MPIHSMNELRTAIFTGNKNEEIKSLLHGMYTYGRAEVERLLAEAKAQNKQLNFYYATIDDLKNDRLSWRFE